MKIIFLLLMVIGLYAETFKEYKLEVMNDMNGFQKAIKPFDKNEVVPKTILQLMEYMAVSENITQADLITLIYLDYKLNVIQKMVYESNKQKKEKDYGKK